MTKPFIHKNFRLNGVSFNNLETLLKYSKSLPKGFYDFFYDWFFLENNNITVNTSGSTGKPKPIDLKKEYMINSAIATGRYFNLKAKTLALLCLPIHFIAGKMMLVRAITLGWHLDVVESNSNPLKKNKKIYDFVAMVPLQVENSLKKLNYIKTLIIGGGVISYTLQQKLQKEQFTSIFATYGMTETITHIAVKKINKLEYTLSYYKTLPNVNIFTDQRGCLVIESKNISNEIIFTNDVVELISKTSFEWLGRYDNVINSGGIKLQPELIEKKLKHFIKQRFFITSIPDEKLGEKVVLVVEESVSNFSKNVINHLDKYERPKEIYFVSKFLETSTKKIIRKRTISLVQKIIKV